MNVRKQKHLTRLYRGRAYLVQLYAVPIPNVLHDWYSDTYLILDTGRRGGGADARARPARAASSAPRLAAPSTASRIRTTERAPKLLMDSSVYGAGREIPLVAGRT